MNRLSTAAMWRQTMGIIVIIIGYLLIAVFVITLIASLGGGEAFVEEGMDSFDVALGATILIIACIPIVVFGHRLKARGNRYGHYRVALLRGDTIGQTAMIVRRSTGFVCYEIDKLIKNGTVSDLNLRLADIALSDYVSAPSPVLQPAFTPNPVLPSEPPPQQSSEPPTQPESGVRENVICQKCFAVLMRIRDSKAPCEYCGGEEFR